MSSPFHVMVTTIDQIHDHPNAERLALAHIAGWQVVIPKGQHMPGEKVVYIPPDSVLPQELSDHLNITSYLSHGRVRCIKLRGEPSFGVIMKPEKQTWELGQDVADHYGIIKYTPPTRSWFGSRIPGSVGLSNPDALEEHALFWRYTNIDNLRHFPAILEEGEEVVVTEKLHGTNSRVALIQGEWMAGSHRVRRKQPDTYDRLTSQTIQLGNSQHVYWYPTLLPEVQSLLTALAVSHQQVILFGEILGDSIQSLHYGYKQHLGYRAFDLMLDGRYLDYNDFLESCSSFGVPVVPLLARIPYSFADIQAQSEGYTTLLPGQKGRSHIREGVVIRPIRERTHPKVGRCIFKYVSDTYLTSKETDFTEE